jgi:transcription elongation GreA/GreB family factor
VTQPDGLTVTFGDQVTLEILPERDIKKVVVIDTANPRDPRLRISEGLPQPISKSSPFARAILGHRVTETVTVTPQRHNADYLDPPPYRVKITNLIRPSGN